MNVALKLSGLKVDYGNIRALSAVTLEVPPAAHVTLLGPSGAGKSTLLRAVAGLVRPLGGSVHWESECWSNASTGTWLPPEHRRIGMIAQDPALWPNLTAAEHLTLALRWRGVPRSQRASQATALLEQVRLTDRSAHRPAALSGGEAQRLAMARALAGGSRLLLLDEPLGQLDAELRPVMAAELCRIARRAQATVLHVTHDPAEAFSLGNPVAVLEAGRLVQCGRPEELMAKPRTRFVAKATGLHNLLSPGTLAPFCQAMGMDPSHPPFAVLNDGTGAFGPARLRLTAAEEKRGLPGQVTGSQFDGKNWLAEVHVPSLGVDLMVNTAVPALAGIQVKLVWLA